MHRDRYFYFCQISIKIGTRQQILAQLSVSIRECSLTGSISIFDQRNIPWWLWEWKQWRQICLRLCAFACARCLELVWLGDFTGNPHVIARTECMAPVWLGIPHFRATSARRNAWILSTNFSETPQQQISWKSPLRFLSCDMRINKQTNGLTDGHGEANRLIFATSLQKRRKILVDIS